MEIVWRMEVGGDGKCVEMGNVWRWRWEVCGEVSVRPYQFDLLIHKYGNSNFSKKDL